MKHPRALNTKRVSYIFGNTNAEVSETIKASLQSTYKSNVKQYVMPLEKKNSWHNYTYRLLHIKK